MYLGFLITFVKHVLFMNFKIKRGKVSNYLQVNMIMSSTSFHVFHSRRVLDYFFLKLRFFSETFSKIMRAVTLDFCLNDISRQHLFS